MNAPQFGLFKSMAPTMNSAPFQIRRECKQFALEVSISQKPGWENLAFAHFFLHTLFFSE